MTEKLANAWDPLGRSCPAPLVEHFTPLGAHLRLETNSPEVVQACRASFGRYGFPSSPDSRDAQIVIRLLVDDAFNEVPPWPDPVFRGQGDIFYVSVGRQNTAIADLEKGHAAGFLTPAMARDAAFLRNTFLECLTFTLLTQGKASTHTYIHGSAVALGDRGLIFCGPSQAGKSTLAFACARRGFRVVTDDVVYLREQDEELNVWGKPWHLRFLPDYTRFFPELSQNTAALRFDGKDCFEIDVDTFLPGQTLTRCKPEAIFFLERCATQPRYEAIDPHEALQLLSRDLVYDRPEVMERHRRFWLRLIQKGCYRLHCGENLDAVVQLLTLFLEKPSGVSDAR
jgi:hypothetical protein